MNTAQSELCERKRTAVTCEITCSAPYAIATSRDSHTSESEEGVLFILGLQGVPGGGRTLRYMSARSGI